MQHKTILIAAVTPLTLEEIASNPLISSDIFIHYFHSLHFNLQLLIQPIIDLVASEKTSLLQAEC